MIISGALLKNDVDGSGINTGEAISEVEILLSKDSKPIFNKKFNQSHQWESSFMGAEAVPKAIKQYPILIEKLINRIFSDRDFNKAIQQ
jgi:hypothetical protein